MATRSDPSDRSDRSTPSAHAVVREVHFSFYTEKVAGEGEDSEPLLMVGYRRAVVAVFDGMGGAGGTVYETPGGRHTGAWFASRVARDVVQGHIDEIVGRGPEIDAARAAELLRDRLRNALARRLAEFGAAKSSLRSKLLRALPTTVVIAYLAADDGDPLCPHLPLLLGR
ncbi:MAG TPA: hypothetical protein VKP64_13220 [Mycobacteriales bacterium]|nr:hypothetical protein [Mycobacteriales bacterium]